MAESIYLHLKHDSVANAAKTLDELLTRDPEGACWYAGGKDDWLFRVEYDDQALRDHEPHEVEALRSTLGALPTCSFYVEIRRSLQRAALPRLRVLAAEFYRRHDGVLDDCLNSLWLPKELQEDGAALLKELE